MSEVRHSKLPWVVSGYRDDDGIHLSIWPDDRPKVGEIGSPVCLIAPPNNITEVDEKNAEFIVDACNSYYKFRNKVNSYDDVVKLLKILHDGGGNELYDECCRRNINVGWERKDAHKYIIAMTFKLTHNLLKELGEI